MAAVALFGAGNATTASSASAASLAVAKPANTADGDVLVALAYSQISIGGTTAPSGWTRVNGWPGRGGGVYYKAVPSASAETATSYTWTFDGGNGRVCLTVLRVVGADLAAPLDTSGTSSFSSGPTSTTPSVTTTGATGLLLGFTVWNNSSATVATVIPAATFTDGVQFSSPTTGNTSGSDVAYKALSSPGATGTFAWGTSPAAVNQCSMVVAFLPAAGFAEPLAKASGTSRAVPPVLRAGASPALVKAAGTASGAAPALSAGSSLALPKVTGTAQAGLPTVSAGTTVAPVRVSGTSQALAPAVSAATGVQVQAVRATASGVSLPPGVAGAALLGVDKALSTGSARVPTPSGQALAGVPVATGGTGALAPVLSAQARVLTPPVWSLGAGLAPSPAAGALADAVSAGSTALALAPGVFTNVETVLEVTFRPRSLQAEHRLGRRSVRLKHSVRVVKFRVL